MGNDFNKNSEWARAWQRDVAVPNYYRSSNLWPNCKITEVDILESELAERLDKSGVDKIIWMPDDNHIPIAQRFVRDRADKPSYFKKECFTLRYKTASGYESEYFKFKRALECGWPLPQFYAWGVAYDGFPDDGVDFKRFAVYKIKPLFRALLNKNKKLKWKGPRRNTIDGNKTIFIDPDSIPISYRIFDSRGPSAYYKYQSKPQRKLSDFSEATE